MALSRSPLAFAVSASLALAAVAVPARAAPPIVDTDAVFLRIGGYARALSGLSVSQVEEGETYGVPKYTGLGAAILRTELRLGLFDIATLDVHSRLFMQVSSESSAGGGAVGLGATAAPERTLDLSTPIVATDTMMLEHDLDRLSLRLFLGPVDVSIGRQAITWGTSLLFNVSDIWAGFSPFELDQSQKRGIDAVRAVTQITPDIELDMVIADRGSLEYLSGGARATFYMDWGDIYVAAAHAWDDVAVMAGASGEIDSFKIRGEAYIPIHGLSKRPARPNVTLGFDWFHPEVMVSVEAHYNGLGADDPDDYLGLSTDLADPRPIEREVFARGQGYLLGRWYLGTMASWRPIETVTLATSLLLNVADPSLLVATTISYQPTADMDIGIGAFNSIGDRPTIVPLRLNSEFGSYGQFVYMQIAAYF